MGGGASKPSHSEQCRIDDLRNRLERELPNDNLENLRTELYFLTAHEREVANQKASREERDMALKATLEREERVAAAQQAAADAKKERQKAETERRQRAEAEALKIRRARETRIANHHNAYLQNPGMEFELNNDELPEVLGRIKKSYADLGIKFTFCQKEDGVWTTTVPSGCSGKKVFSMNPEQLRNLHEEIQSHARAEQKIAAYLLLNNPDDSPELRQIVEDAKRRVPYLVKNFEANLRFAHEELNGTDGGTRLHYPDGSLSREDALIACKFLVKKCGAKVNKPDNDVYTPLHYAARKADKERCLFLINSGADPFAKNNYYKRTPLDVVGRNTWNNWINDKFSEQDRNDTEQLLREKMIERSVAAPSGNASSAQGSSVVDKSKKR